MRANIYKARRDLTFAIVLPIAPLVCWGFMLAAPNPILFCVASLISLLFAWIWFDTSYMLRDGFLLYRSGPLRGKISISTLNEIHTHVRSFGGIRPALSFEYLRIRYEGNNELFIAPQNERSFIEEIKEHNPSVLIMDEKA
jgi:hypothetical protein